MSGDLNLILICISFKYIKLNAYFSKLNLSNIISHNLILLVIFNQILNLALLYILNLSFSFPPLKEVNHLLGSATISSTCTHSVNLR